MLYYNTRWISRRNYIVIVSVGFFFSSPRSIILDHFQWRTLNARLSIQNSKARKKKSQRIIKLYSARQYEYYNTVYLLLKRENYLVTIRINFCRTKKKKNDIHYIIFFFYKQIRRIFLYTEMCAGCAHLLVEQFKFPRDFCRKPVVFTYPDTDKVNNTRQIAYYFILI